MIREAHDYRVGLFDRYCRKLTGRSYSAIPQAVVRDYPPETMRPGDVFIMNDTYPSEGAIGHLPDLCSTVPVFQDGEVVAYIQAFGHHDDIGRYLPEGVAGRYRERAHFQVMGKTMLSPLHCTPPAGATGPCCHVPQ